MALMPSGSRGSRGHHAHAAHHTHQPGSPITLAHLAAPGGGAHGGRADDTDGETDWGDGDSEVMSCTSGGTWGAGSRAINMMVRRRTTQELPEYNNFLNAGRI